VEAESKSASIRSKPNEIKIEFYPSSEKSMLDKRDITEIHNLVAQIVLTGKKRGRPLKKDLEVDYVA
jgi:hypothetical protein